MQVRFMALALCLPAAACAHAINNTPLTLTTTPASACIAQNFDAVSAPALPPGWSSNVTGAVTTVPWATRSVGYVDTGANAVWLDDTNDYADVSLTSPAFAVRSSTAIPVPYVTFRHSFVLWSPDSSPIYSGAYNGGVLELSVNGGAFVDAANYLYSGGYSAQLDPSSDNPIAQPPVSANRSVWSGDSNGFITTTVVPPPAAIGGTIQFRWRLSTGGGGRSHDTHSGWWIDTLQYGGLGDEIFLDGFDAPCVP